MADKLFGISLGDQRLKWLMVAGLAAILLAVLIGGGSDSPAGAGAETAPAARKRIEPPADNPNVVKSARFRWNGTSISEEDFETMLRFDPFAAKSSLQQQLLANAPNPPPTPEQLAEKAQVVAARQKMAELRERKVSVIFKTAGGAAAALIGGRVIREGETFDGIKVISISAAGVVVEAVTEPPRDEDSGRAE